MKHELWQEMLLPAGNEDHLWELFHENSKISRYGDFLSKEEVLERMGKFHESLPYEGYPMVELPGALTELTLPLKEALAGRISVREMMPCALSLEDMATLLHFGYGVTRDNKGTTLPRPFRVVPSGGALYPLEIFFYSSHVESLRPGLYHYNPSRHNLRLLREGDAGRTIAEGLVQPDMASKAAAIIFLTALFERSVFKYGDRGYRFILLEAGHVAQNINLVACGLGLGCLNIGGFFDRRIDELLDLDGLTHSTVYMVAIGGKVEVREPKSTEKRSNHGN